MPRLRRRGERSIETAGAAAGDRDGDVAGPWRCAPGRTPSRGSRPGLAGPRPRARRRARPGVGRPAGGPAGDREVHPRCSSCSARSRPPARRVCWSPARSRAPRWRRGLGGSASRSTTSGSRRGATSDVVLDAARGRAPVPCWPSTRSRPSATRRARRCRAASPRSGCAPTRSSGWPRPRDRGAPDGPRHEGRRPGRAAGPRARRRRRPGVRRRSALGPAGARRRQEPVRRRGRDGLVRDGSARPRARSIPTGLLVLGRAAARAPPSRSPRRGRRALAVEVQALVGVRRGRRQRRQATGLDPRRFQLVAAVLDRAVGLPARPRRPLRGVRRAVSGSTIRRATSPSPPRSPRPPPGSRRPPARRSSARSPSPGRSGPRRGCSSGWRPRAAPGATSVFAPGRAEGAPAGLHGPLGRPRPQALGWAHLRNDGDAPGPCRRRTIRTVGRTGMAL